MQETIRTLTAHLEALRPELYAMLNAPLSDSEIDTLENRFHVKLPADLRALYSWKNGQHADCTEAFVNNSMFVPLEEALETALENTGMIGSDFDVENWWHAQWIPVFHNGGGDYICYDAGGLFTGQQGQLIEFWHADNDRNVIAPTLQCLLEKLNEYYDSTPVAEYDDYFEIKSPEGFPKKFMLE